MTQRILNHAWLHILFIIAVMASIYLLTAFLGNNLKPHPDVYFDYLAQAFLNGRLDISPTVHYDLTPYGLKWYVPFLPMPSFLMLPLVAKFGPGNGWQVPFSAFVGALNVALVFLLLQSLTRRHWTRLCTRSNLVLVLLFGLGTVHWYMAADGRVWFVSQIVSTTILLVVLLLAVLHSHPLSVGIALGLLVWTRPHLLLVLPLVLVCVLQDEQGKWQVSGMNLSALFMPLIISLLLLGWYNWARFTNPFDLGYLTEQVAPKLARNLHQYGQFNPVFISNNFYWEFTSLAQFTWQFPFFTPDSSGDGMSILLVTPALLYLFRHLPRGIWMWSAWVCLLLLNVPLLLYYNTGWIQFGYRFALDYMVIAICLIAGNAGERISVPLLVLILVSVLVNLHGVNWWFLTRPLLLMK